MTKKDFVSKWGIDSTSVYHYKKRFPEILSEDNKINYLKLNEIIEYRDFIREKVKTLMADRKPKDIEWLFSGENAKEMSHNFVYQLYATKEQILVRDSVFEKYLKVIEYFGEKK